VILGNLINFKLTYLIEFTLVLAII
jgi:hypothetical protein